jgi:hypothetical protein
MPSESRHLPEQEISIKTRAHELFVKPTTEEVRRAPKPFPVYLRETPASPMSSTVKAALWFAAIIVLLLFLASVWKLSVRHGPRRAARAPRVSSHRDHPARPDPRSAQAQPTHHHQAGR